MVSMVLPVMEHHRWTLTAAAGGTANAPTDNSISLQARPLLEMVAQGPRSIQPFPSVERSRRRWKSVNATSIGLARAIM